MQEFRACAGKNVCSENDTHCLACGRSLEAIARTRQLVDELVEFALAEDYGNVDDFMAYVSKRVAKKIQHQKEQA
jgi:hypothetical protein